MQATFYMLSALRTSHKHHIIDVVGSHHLVIQHLDLSLFAVFAPFWAHFGPILGPILGPLFGLGHVRRTQRPSEGARGARAPARLLDWRHGPAEELRGGLLELPAAHHLRPASMN